jgi:hypothetical protein
MYMVLWCNRVPRLPAIFFLGFQSSPPQGWRQFTVSYAKPYATYWCLVGNVWEWGNGMIIDRYCGSFPHTLLRTSKAMVGYSILYTLIISHNPWFFPSTSPVYHHIIFGSWPMFVVSYPFPCYQLPGTISVSPRLSSHCKPSAKPSASVSHYNP